MNDTPMNDIASTNSAIMEQSAPHSFSSIMSTSCQSPFSSFDTYSDNDSLTAYSTSDDEEEQEDDDFYHDDHSILDINNDNESDEDNDEDSSIRGLSILLPWPLHHGQDEEQHDDDPSFVLSTTSPSTPPSSFSKKQQVTFGSVYIRHYACTVGDHPLCHDSCPLSLDWKYYYIDQEEEDEVDDDDDDNASCSHDDMITHKESHSSVNIPLHTILIDAPSHNPHNHGAGWVPRLSYEQRRARVLDHIIMMDDDCTITTTDPSSSSSDKSWILLLNMERALMQRRLAEYVHESPHARAYLQGILQVAAATNHNPCWYETADHDNRTTTTISTIRHSSCTQQAMTHEPWGPLQQHEQAVAGGGAPISASSADLSVLL